jgi:hypothetical protein
MVDTYAVAITAERCAKQPYTPYFPASSMQTEPALSFDDALKICEEGDKRFQELKKYMPTQYIFEYLNTIHAISAKEIKILVMTLQTFKVMPKDIHN